MSQLASFFAFVSISSFIALPFHIFQCRDCLLLASARFLCATCSRCKMLHWLPVSFGGLAEPCTLELFQPSISTSGKARRNPTETIHF
jgi:hypothetical protein